MSNPGKPSPPAADKPSPTSQPTYGNIGEIRAHLLPTKSRRLRTTERLSPEAPGSPLPPPLPQKTLSRTKSLPTKETRQCTTCAGLQPSLLKVPSRQQGSLQAPFSSQKPSESPPGQLSTQAWDLQELTFSTEDRDLGCFFSDLGSQEEVLTGLVRRQLGSLRWIEAQLESQFMGEQWLGTVDELGVDLSLLDDKPCAESGDAWYYRVSHTTQASQHILAAKVHKPDCLKPDPKPSGASGSALQGTLPPHFNVQRLCGWLAGGSRALGLWREEALAVALVAEVPSQTVADWTGVSAGLHRAQPGPLERQACLLLLQLCTALEHLHGQGLRHGDLRPQNLLLLGPTGPPALPRLLLSNFARAERLGPGGPGTFPGWEDVIQLGLLVYDLLHLDRPQELATPAPIPVRSPFSAGLSHLVPQLLHGQLSAHSTGQALQALLWGPEPLTPDPPLPSWLALRQALLGLRLAEQAVAEGPGGAGLEDWLCCRYLTRVSEDSLGLLTVKD
ncbi:protein PEAK3 isoform X2 [Ornithorhynchus anatinus]|uniref:PEAK family member 3 n=1 Tax=Ornithorhynchus anatinus TaxID=9258 RepID=K7ED29_ORNAN|nr:protein PEAK3 isoform X2 [Ornithorhynchus anatinus]XP_028913183.1 protein PEAK3 isoform X2 [Ornithorhynchus anatinus]XP_028913185.1 protein PEAK3 isoform X2 [Ornithorhynchus anatinus]XP_028913186.1 protein PEAK3 isoform X2 [Ornithorhynchus anatinus]